jgi:hypothetical protein
VSNADNDGTGDSIGKKDQAKAQGQAAGKQQQQVQQQRKQSSKDVVNAVGNRRIPNLQPKSKVPGPSKNVKKTSGQGPGPAKMKKVDPVSSSSSQDQTINNIQTSQVVEVTQQRQQQQQQTQEEQIVKSHPARGRATVVCGCYGTKHPALTNCLYCGRISCSVEGYGYCPFCGMMVDEIIEDEEYVYTNDTQLLLLPAI